MTFLGWSLGEMAALGAAAASVVVVLYILKLRRRPIAVPFAAIWHRVLLDRETTTLFARLRRLFSLLLALTIVLLLVLALGDPRRSVVRSEGKSYFVLVDESASMQATDVVPSRIEVAKRRLRELVRGLGPNDRMLIAGLGKRVTPLSTLTDDTAELTQAIERLEARDTEADLGRGLALAQASLASAPGGVVVLLSDGGLEGIGGASSPQALGNLEFAFESIGRAGTNAAITGFSVRRYPLDKSRYEAMVELANPSEVPLEVELSLFGDGSPIDVARFSMRPGETLRRFHQDLAGVSRTLEAELTVVSGGRDWLDADNHAYALVPDRRRARVLVVTEGNNYLEAALLLDEYLDVTTIEPSQYPPAESYDVTIFDRAAPKPDARTGSLLYLDPPSAGSPVRRGKRLEMFGFDRWDEKSLLLRWMALGDIQVLDGSVLEPGPHDRVVGASEFGPILVEGERAGQRFVALGFDPRRSDWVLRVAWPLFVLNTIQVFVEQDTTYLESYRSGEPWYVAVPAQLSQVQVRPPVGERFVVPVQAGRAVFLGERRGFYELYATGREPIARVAANLASATESQIEPVREWLVGSGKASKISGLDAKVRENLWVFLLLVAVLLSLVEWFTYHRRWTV